MTSTNFAPYAPPPDEQRPFHSTAQQKAPIRPWFPTHASSQPPNESSYQSGGIPTFNNSASGGDLAAPEPATNQWETRYGARIDLLAALAYLLGPISALLLLIFETTNDYVRFHAYQSALLTTPLVALRIFASLAQFYPFLRTLMTLLLVTIQLYMAGKAYYDAIHTGLARYQLPYIGEIAERWLQEE